MNILLTAVNAKFIHSNPAVYSLRAFAAEYREHIHIAEYTINQYAEDILADIYRQKPDVIAFSCYIWNWTLIRSLLNELPKVLPDTAVWLGGPEVSYDAPDILRELPGLSGIMIGEGEETFRELARHYVTNSGTLHDIAGLCLPRTGYTSPRAVTPLAAIPFFYDDLTVFRDRILYYESSRGCPFRCSYCLSSIDKTTRFRPLEMVYRELDFFLSHAVRQVKFIDRTFNCDHARCLAIWQYIALHDNGVTNFHFEIAADLLTDGEIALLRSFRPGLAQLEIGVQTTNNLTLSAIHRKMDVDHLRRVVSLLREKRNIHLHLDLIAGLPHEDLASFRRSFDDVYRMGGDDLQLGFLKVLKGSFMAEHAAEYRLRYLSRPPYEVLSTSWISYADLLELKRVEKVLEMYHNSGQYISTLRELERDLPSPYELYLSLADYYTSRGFDSRQPSRMDKMCLLLDFAIARHPEKAELFRECMTYDAYARESCPRRPDFASDLRPYKEDIRLLGAPKENHTDIFRYSVWTDSPARLPSPRFVIFDYSRRDPLTGNAAIRVAE